MFLDCICLVLFYDKVISVEEVFVFIEDGMIVGMSGFICVGEVKVVFLVLVKCVYINFLKIILIIGVFLGNDLDK